MTVSKVHYDRSSHRVGVTACGISGRITYDLNAVTCRVCWFHILADVAPWARGFLNELRGKARPGQLDTVSVPAALPEPVDGKVIGLGNGIARALNQYRGSQKAVRELLPMFPASLGTVQPVVDDRGPPADAVRIEEGKITEQAGDTGQISDEAYWNY